MHLKHPLGSQLQPLDSRTAGAAASHQPPVLQIIGEGQQLLGCHPEDGQDCFANDVTNCLSNPSGPHTGALVQGNELTGNKGGESFGV